MMVCLLVNNSSFYLIKLSLYFLERGLWEDEKDNHVDKNSNSPSEPKHSSSSSYSSEEEKLKEGMLGIFYKLNQISKKNDKLLSESNELKNQLHSAIEQSKENKEKAGRWEALTISHKTQLQNSCEKVTKLVTKNMELEKEILFLKNPDNLIASIKTVDDCKKVKRDFQDIVEKVEKKMVCD
jgi:hypothetical protein